MEIWFVRRQLFAPEVKTERSDVGNDISTRNDLHRDNEYSKLKLRNQPENESWVECKSDLAKLTSEMAECGNDLKEKIDSLHITVGKESSPVSGTLVRDIRNRTSCIESEMRRLENQLDFLEETLKNGEVREVSGKQKRKLSSVELKEKLEVLKKEKCDLEEEKKEWLKEVQFLKCQLQYREEVKQLQGDQRKGTDTVLEHENKELKQENDELKRRLQSIQETMAEKTECKDDILVQTERLDSEDGRMFNAENELLQLRRERKMLLSTIMKLQNETESESKEEVETRDISTQCQIGAVRKDWFPQIKNNDYKDLQKELEQLRKETEDLEDENRILDEENARFVEEKRVQEDTINKLKRQLTDALDSSIDEIEIVSGLKLELETRLEITEKQNKELLNLLDELKEENCYLLDSILDDIEQKESLDEAIDFLFSEVDKIIQLNKSRKYSLSELEKSQTANKHEPNDRGFLLTEFKTCKSLVEDQRHQIRKLQMEKRDIEENYTKIKRELVIMKTRSRAVNPIGNAEATKETYKRKVSESARNIDVMETVEERSESVFEENELLRNDNESLQGEIKNLKTRRKELEILAKKLKEETCVLEEEKACLLSSLFNQVERCNTLEQQIEDLKSLPGENEVAESKLNNFEESGDNDINKCSVAIDVSMKDDEITDDSNSETELITQQLENLQQFVQELESEKQQLRESLKATQKNLHELQQERLLLSEKVQKGDELSETLQERLREARDEKQELTDNLEKLADEKTKLENHKKDWDSLLKEKLDKLDSMSKTLDNLKTENKETCETLESMENEFRCLYNKLKTIASSISTGENRKESLDETKSEELEHEKDVTEIGDNLKVFVETITEELERMQVDLEKTKWDHKQMNVQLEATLQEKAFLQKLVRETEEKRRQMKSFLTRLTDEKEAVNEQLDDVKQQKKNLAEALENVYQGKEALQNALDNALLKQQQTSQALYEATNDNKSLRDSLYRVVEERDTFREGVVTARNEVQLLTESERKYKDRARGLQEEVDKLDEEASELRDSQRKSQKERDEMKQLVADLINERNELATKIEDLMNWEQVLKTNLAKAALENDEAVATASDLKNSAESLAKENLQLRGHLQQFLDNYSESNDSEVPIMESPIYGCQQVELFEENLSNTLGTPVVTTEEKTDFDTSSEEREILKRQSSDLSTQNLKLRALLETVTDAKEALENKLEHISAENTNLQNLLRSKEDMLDALRANCERVCEELDELKCSFEEAIIDKEKAKEELSKLSFEKDGLSRELQQKTKEWQKLKCCLEEEQTALLKKLKGISEEFAKLQGENKDLKEYISKAEEELLTSTGVQNSIDDGIPKLQFLLRQLFQEEEKLKTEVQSLSFNNQKLKSESEKLTKEKHDIKKEIDKFSEENENLSREFEMTALAIDKLKTNLIRVPLQFVNNCSHCKLAESEQKVSLEWNESEKELETDFGDKSKLQKNLQQLNHYLTHLKIEFTEMKKTKDQLSQNFNDLTASNKDLDKQLESALQEKDSFKETADKLTEEQHQALNAVREEGKKLTEMLKDARESLTDLEADVEQERHKSENVRVLCDQLKQELEQKDYEFKECVETHSKEILLMKEELKASQEELNERLQELRDKDILLQRLNDESAKVNEKENYIKDRCSQLSRTIEENREIENKLRIKLEGEVTCKKAIQENLNEITQKLNEANQEVEKLKSASAILKISEENLKSRVQNLDLKLSETSQALDKSRENESSLLLTVAQQDKEVSSIKLSTCELKAELQAVMEERNVLQKDKTKLQAEVESSICDLNKLRSSFEESDKKYRSATEEREKMKQELDLLRNEKDAMFLEGSKLIEDLKKEAIERELTLEQTSHKLDESKRSLQHAQDESSSFRQEFREIKNQKEKLEESLKTLKDRVNELRNNCDETSSRELDLKKELEKKIEEEEEKNKELVELRKLLDSEKNKFQNLERLAERLKKENNTLKRWVDNKAEEKQRVDKSLKEKEDQRRKMEKLNQELEERLKLLHNDKTITEDQLRKEKESSANLLYRLEEANEDKEELEEILEGLQTKKKKLQEDLDRAILEKEAWEEQLTTLKETLDNQVADLTESERNLKNALELSETEKNALKQEMKEKEQRLNEAQIQIQVLKSELTDTKQQMEACKIELDRHTTSMKKDREILCDLKEKLEEREMGFVEAKNKFQSVADELNDSRKEITVLRTKLRELRTSKGKMEKEAEEKEQTLSLELSYLRNRENTLLRTLKERDKTIETLKEEVTMKNRKNEELRGQLEEEAIKVKNLNDKMQDILQEKQKLEKDCKLLESENETINKQHSESCDKVNSLQNEIKKLVQQNEQTARLSTLKEEVVVPKNEAVTFVEFPIDSEIPTVFPTEEISSHSRTLSNAQKEISELEFYIKELQEDLRKVREELFDLQHEVADKERELKQKERLHQQERKRFQNNINELEEEQSRLEKQLSSFLALEKNRSSFSTVKELKGNLRKAESEMLEAIGKISEVQQKTKNEVVVVKKESQLFQEGAGHIDGTTGKTAVEMKQLQGKLQDALKEKEQLLTKLKRVEASKAFLKETIYDLILQIDNLRQLIARIPTSNEFDNTRLRKRVSLKQQTELQEEGDGPIFEEDYVDHLRQSFERLQKMVKSIERNSNEEQETEKGKLFDVLRTNEKLQAENDCLAQRVNVLEKDKIFRDRELFDLRNEKQKLQKQLQSENKKIENLEKSLQQSEDSQKSLKDSLNETKQETQLLQEERLIDKEEVEKMRMQMESETRLQNKNVDDLAKVQRNKNELTCAKAALEMRYKMLEAKNQEKENALKSNQQDLSELESLSKALQDNLIEAVEEKKKLVADTYAFKIKLESEISDLTSRLTKKDEKFTELQKKYTLLIRHNQKLTEQLQGSCSEREDLGKKLCEAETVKESLEKVNEEYSSYLAEQKDESQRKIEELNSELENSRVVSHKLEKKVERLEQLLNEHAIEENKIKQEKEKLSQDLNAVQKNLDEKVKQMEELANLFQVREDKLQQKISSLTANIEARTEEREKMQGVVNTISQLKKEYNQLEDENSKLIESLAKVQEQNIELKKENILFRKACNQLRGRKMSEEKMILNHTESSTLPTDDLATKRSISMSPSSSWKSDTSSDPIEQQKKLPPHLERSSPEGSEIPDASLEKNRNLQPALHSTLNKNLISGADSDSGLMIRVASFVNSVEGEEEKGNAPSKGSGKKQKSSIKLQTCVKEGRRRTHEISSTDLTLANEQVARRATQEIVPVSIEVSDSRSKRPGSTDTESTAVSCSSTEGSGKAICTKNYCSPILSLVDACPLHRIPSTERTKDQCPVCKKEKNTGTRLKQFITLEKYV